LIVVGTALSRADALALAIEKCPDIIILDLDLGTDDGLEFLPELLQATQQRARVIILTGVRDPEAHYRAFSLGACGLVMKEQASEVLLRAIEKVRNGEIWIERSMMTGVLQNLKKPVTASTNPEAAKIATLTEREREVIALICEGLKNQQIADRLFITPGTVRNHLNSIFTKLDVADRLELAVYSYQNGLAKLTPREP
jgi:DNA-binding NarL/FixJ family response regulator